ncbi:MAG: TonB-dependent receptor domain-containing protein, partial [Muribaculaceae bacterium]
NFDFYAGVRYEYNNQVLKMNTLQYQESLHNTTYRDNDFFPSLNITYRLPLSQQLRLAYGKSVNRPEFRELSTSVYYDFDLGSNVMGNYDLKTAYIHNLDFRYEWYPSDGEQVSVALFYKHFSNPIEWTYTVAGGTDLIYSFVNAREANNYGIELDVRKSLDFIGLRYFSLSFNGSIIKSKVNFDGNTNNIDRPMQGQSPYLINAGVFYNNRDKGWTASLLYNRIGKRIIGVGNRYGTGSDGSARNIPNSYEMPRNTIDLSAAKRFGKWELKLALRDILAERCVFKQFEDVEINGEKRTIEETTRSFRPGRNFSLSITYNF